LPPARRTLPAVAGRRAESDERDWDLPAGARQIVLKAGGRMTLRIFDGAAFAGAPGTVQNAIPMRSFLHPASGSRVPIGPCLLVRCAYAALCWFDFISERTNSCRKKRIALK
jgi:hypothetical protein